MAKYFMFSRTQQREQIKIAETINKKHIVGKVYHKGIWNQYTEILNTPNSRFSDATVILISEDDTLDNINFTDVSFESR